jgi:hypothetical protein
MFKLHIAYDSMTKNDEFQKEKKKPIYLDQNLRGL